MLDEEFQTRGDQTAGMRERSRPHAVFEYTIRDAGTKDLPDVCEIYNHYVAATTITFDEEPLSLRDWRAKFADAQKLDLPFLVAQSPHGQILGYALVAPWKRRPAYRYTAEDSIYLRPSATGKGLGPALFAELIARSQRAGIRELVAVVADRGAEPSLRLHELFGFVEVGRLSGIGYKFDEWLGWILLQKSLD